MSYCTGHFATVAGGHALNHVVETSNDTGTLCNRSTWNTAVGREWVQHSSLQAVTCTYCLKEWDELVARGVQEAGEQRFGVNVPNYKPKYDYTTHAEEQEAPMVYEEKKTTAATQERDRVN